MAGKTPIVAVALGASSMTLAYGAALFPPLTRAAPWLMVGGITLLILGLFQLGVRSRHQAMPASVKLGLLFLGLVLLGGFGAALLLPAETATGPLLLGLPRRAALIIYGIGLLPVPVLPLVYALSFERTVLSEASLAELRSRLAELRAKEPAP